MSKRFVVCTNSSTKDEHKAFIEFLNANKVGYWHHLSNTWLIIDTKEVLTNQGLRNTVKELFNNTHNIVLELNSKGDTWSGFGPSSETKNMFTWLKKYWKSNKQ